MSSSVHHDEPDPFKILFLKGPKHKHLAKVCISAYIHCSSLLTVLSARSVSNRPAMPAIKANADVMVLVVVQHKAQQCRLCNGHYNRTPDLGRWMM